MNAQKKAIKYILFGQASLILAMLGCFIIKPHHDQNNSSLSYYGNFRTTIVPYAIGIILEAYSLFKAANLIAGLKNLIYVRRGMQAFSGTLLLVPLTPFSLGIYFLYAHLLVSVILALVNLFLVFYCVLNVVKNWQSYILALINLGGIVGCILSIAEIHVLHYEAIFELVLLTSLSLVLVRTLTINSVKQSVEGKI